MTPAVILAAAIAPGLFWLWVFTRGRSYRPRPPRLLAVTFSAGALVVIPAGLIEVATIPDDSWGVSTTAGAIAAVMFFIVGPVEETSKFLAVRFTGMRSSYFEEPLDGLLYSVAASLGFATAENIVYAFNYGPEVMLARGPLSTVAHLVFGAIWGITLGLGPRGRRRTLLIIAGVAGAAVAHGLFNLFASLGPAGVPGALALAGVGAVLVVRMFRWGRRVSPFRLQRNVPFMRCPGCGGQYRMGANFCTRCGARATPLASVLVCGHCRTESWANADYCASCGDRFVRRMPA